MTHLQKYFDAFDVFDSLFLSKNNYTPIKPKEEYKFKVPGFGKEDLTAKITSDGYLYIKGDNGEDTFEKYLQIPGLHAESKINIKCDKGILKIKLPKNETKEITIH